MVNTGLLLLMIMRGGFACKIGCLLFGSLVTLGIVTVRATGDSKLRRVVVRDGALFRKIVVVQQHDLFSSSTKRSFLQGSCITRTFSVGGSTYCSDNSYNSIFVI